MKREQGVQFRNGWKVAWMVPNDGWGEVSACGFEKAGWILRRITFNMNMLEQVYLLLYRLDEERM